VSASFEYGHGNVDGGSSGGVKHEYSAAFFVEFLDGVWIFSRVNESSELILRVDELTQTF
jgi:hypothetical protein